MRRVTLQDSVVISPDVVFRELEGEAVMLDLASSTYFGLDEVGTRIWSLLQQDGSLSGVFDSLREEYDVAPEVLERDLLRLTGELCEKGLVRVAPAAERGNE